MVDMFWATLYQWMWSFDQYSHFTRLAGGISRGNNYTCEGWLLVIQTVRLHGPMLDITKLQISIGSLISIKVGEICFINIWQDYMRMVRMVMVHPVFESSSLVGSISGRPNFFQWEKLLLDEFFIIIIIIIIIIIKALSQLFWGWLHELCFSILIYAKPNPQKSCTSPLLAEFHVVIFIAIVVVVIIIIALFLSNWVRAKLSWF